MENGKEELDGANGQDGSEGQVEDRFAKLEERLSEWEKKQSSMLGKWGNELGEYRQTFSELKDMLSQRNDNDEDFDPFQRGNVEKIVDERAEAKLNDWLNTTFMPNLKKSQQLTQVVGEFNLSEEEVREASEYAQKEGLSLRGAALDLYSDRVTQKKTNRKAKELGDELKNKDTNPPPEPARESQYSKLGIPSDPVEYREWYRNTPKEKRRELMRKAAEEEEG